MTEIRRLFHHMYWAEDRLMGLFEKPGVEPGGMEEVTRLFGHLVAAEQVWLLRVTGGDAASIAIWPHRPLADSVRVAAEVRDGYQRLLGGITDAALGRVVEYRNSKGTAFRNPLRDILLHVALHGAYHRGQIAAAVRRAGGEPVNTDFITFVRDEG